MWFIGIAFIRLITKEIDKKAIIKKDKKTIPNDLKFEKNAFLLNFNVNILSNFSKKEFPPIAKKVEVSFMENQDSFSEKEWKDLYKLSENTFVEETDSLKQGAAGAGLTDND